MDRKAAVRTARAYVRLAGRMVDSDRSYLFGSYAAGTAGADSYLDVGIIVPHLQGDYFDLLTRLYSLRGKVDVRIEPHLVVKDADPSGFSGEIERTCIRL